MGRPALQLRAALAFAVSLTAAGAARADEAQRQDRSPAQVEWNDAWVRFQPWEYAATGAAWTQALLMRFVGPPLNRERGTFSLDDRIVSALSLSGSAYDAASTIANAGYLGSMAYRLLDSTVVPGLVWSSPDVALQMTMIDLEAFAIAAVVLWNAQIIYGRERPGYRNCPSSDQPSVNCDTEADDRYRSFIAGHTLIASTAAGLTCVHHSHLPLYGGGVADDLACGGMIGVAAAVGLARVMMQEHYPTDTLLGWGIGALAGYVVPSALHYGFGNAPGSSMRTRQGRAPGALRLAVIPGVETNLVGATLAGTF